MSYLTAGGGGQPTYLKVPIETTTKLFAWEDNPLTIRVYTINENPSVYEPLYNKDGVRLTNYIISGKKNKTILIKNKTNNVVVEARYSKTNNTNKTIANSVFYKNGGGGSGARGENWVTGLSETPRKGGAGGGYYWLNTDTLELVSVSGRNAGKNDNSLDVGLFPNVHSGKGGASGTGKGATVVEQKTNYYNGIGATGANSALNQYSGQADAYFGSGGGGAGGDEDASGGRAGQGSSDYIDNTTGENATNYHTAPTASTNYLKQPSILGQGGKAANGFISAENGHNGWLYIYKYEREYQIFDMGMVNGDVTLIKPDIDAGYVINPIDKNKTMDGGVDFDSSNYLNTGEIFYEEEFRDCGEISDNNIEEAIKLGGI